MRIGEFSHKFHTAPSTVRYYVDNGLLVPLKQNSQYIFTETDEREMHLINRLKDLSFTLNEIKKFLQVMRVYNSSDYKMGSMLRQIYADKRRELSSIISLHKKQLREIDSEIAKLSGPEHPKRDSRGIPLACTSLLACPKCEKMLNIDHVTIHDNQIHNGEIHCSCGYHASIENGIIVSNSDTSFYMSEQFLIEHYRRIPDQDDDFVYFEYMNNISKQTTAMLSKAYAWMNGCIEKRTPTPRVVIIPDLSCHYLYKYIDAPYFRDALIVVSGFSKSNICAMKSHFDAMKNNLNILYVANTIYELPIRKNSGELWIDAISSYNFSFFHNQSMLHHLLDPYLADDVAIIGLSKYLDPSSKSLKNIRKLYSRSHTGNSLLATLQEALKTANYKVTKDERLGYVVSPGKYYEYMEPAEKHWYYGYCAQKAHVIPSSCDIT
ncbi:MAG: MerR family transcriptional regulator [Clostridiales Family XIII bacterium]|nr:MerR family transcriptional regulator [Clostridiales Family XIII bacterium]